MAYEDFEIDMITGMSEDLEPGKATQSEAPGRRR